MSLRRYVSMDDNKRYKLFKLILIFTILNVFGIFLYENIYEKGLFRKRPEFYVESVKSEPSKTEISKKTDSSILKNEGEQTEVARDEKSAERKILIIGDSNVYLMSQNDEYYKRKYKNNIYWLAESGVTTEFIDENLKVSFGKLNTNYAKNSLSKAKEISLLDEIGGKEITDIVVLLGVNSLEEPYAKSLCDKLIKLKELSKAEVYYVSVLPYVNKARYKINSVDIVKFNNVMKKRLTLSGINYVDAYGLLTETDEYKSETTDGLHYSSIIYDKIFEKIMTGLVQNN